MQDIVVPIAELIESSFSILTALKDLPNTLFFLIGSAGALYWIVLQQKLSNTAKREGKRV